MKLISTLAMFVFLIGQMMGQVSEAEAELSLGLQNAFVIQHPNAEKKMVSKIWEKRIKEFGKVNSNKKAKEWNCLQCTVPGITGPANVYFKVVEGKDMISTYTFIDDGTKFISSENAPEVASNIKKLLTHSAHDVTREVFTKELEGEEKTLKNKNKDLEKLEKKNKDLHEDIEKYKEKIAKAESDIEKNLTEQDIKKQEIEAQTSVVQEVTDRLNNVGKN